jgi:hypothetical protein
MFASRSLMYNNKKSLELRLTSKTLLLRERLTSGVT